MGQGVEKIPIQHVLANVCDELNSLETRLLELEKLIFDSAEKPIFADQSQRMQDMDLIIQQIADLARAVRIVADVEVDGATVKTTILGDALHLSDLRARLLGVAESNLLNKLPSNSDVMFF